MCFDPSGRGTDAVAEGEETVLSFRGDMIVFGNEHGDYVGTYDR